MKNVLDIISCFDKKPRNRKPKIRPCFAMSVAQNWFRLNELLES